MSYKIITHYGKAHMDELLAISLIAVYKKEMPAEILRMNPQEASVLLESGDYEEGSYFIDCGLVHDAERNMFDHHQDNNLPCSALLVFEDFFPELADSTLHKYIELVSKVDTQGLKALSDFDTSKESSKYYSFTQKLLLKTFEDNALQIVEIFKEGLEEKIAFAEKRIIASEWLNKDGNVEIKEVDNSKVLVYMNKPPIDMFQAIRAEDSSIIDKYEASAVYSFDEERDQVRTLFRTNHGYDNIDFCKSEVSEPVFCHKGGFLLKFVPSDENEWASIVSQSAYCPQV